MRKLSFTFFICFIAGICFGQKLTDHKKNPAICIQFFLNDFSTASNIKSSSIGAAINNKDWSQIKDMNAGIAFQYLKGFNVHIDFYTTAELSFLSYPFKNKIINSQLALIEANGGIHLKLLPDNYVIVPYLSAGAGLSFYKIYFGAYVPVGAGFQFNIAKEKTFIFTNIQYRFSVTDNTSDHLNYSIGVSIAVK